MSITSLVHTIQTLLLILKRELICHLASFFEPRLDWGSKPFNVRFKGIRCKGRHKGKVMNT